MVKLGELFYLDKAHKLYTNIGEGNLRAQSHLKDRIFTGTTQGHLSVCHNPPPENKLAMERGEYGKEGYKLTSEEFGVHMDVQQAPTPTLRDSHSPFRYVINEPQLCVNISNLYIINLIATAPQDHDSRTLIREMWGNKMWTKNTGFRTVFLLGETQDTCVQEAVREESLIHHDIIQFSFLDSYNNLTLKILSGLHWVENFCPTPIWVLKSDVDCLVNIFALTRYGRAGPKG